ncbi:MULTISPECIES: hypothetical protein [Lysinibacillus]|uniref:Uncharacterized protein n=3 Tax=Bacillaceae TaxID=186817 RepID=W7S124_LYSSH|nr:MULTISPECIES: hypothetical protein [Lysinibacillus]EWH30393.1 hypothetical protein P799_25770 [Lysinibacillus sphaericus CBAM5]MCS1395302.1 hypothetical protein [Lysinibacillus sp. PB211]MDR0161684.1 hypothetical protein [Lysinibacillus sphaericus]
MRKLNRHMLICSLLLLVGILLTACGSNIQETSQKETATAEPTTRIYKDYLGH